MIKTETLSGKKELPKNFSGKVIYQKILGGKMIISLLIIDKQSTR